MRVAVLLSAAILTFAILAALALPRLETGLTFVPILAISVVAGVIAFFAHKGLARRKNPR